MGAGLGDDLKRPQELLGEFLRRTGGADVLRADIGLVSDVEVRCGESVPVRLDLVSGLHFGDPLSECGMELFEVDGELAGPRGGEVTLRMYCESGVISLVSEERRESGSGVRSVVVGKLR